MKEIGSQFLGVPDHELAFFLNVYLLTAYLYRNSSATTDEEAVNIAMTVRLRLLHTINVRARPYHIEMLFSRVISLQCLKMDICQTN